MVARADDPIAELASGNFNTVKQGVEDLALSGNPRAAAILSALQSGSLYATAGKLLLIKADNGGYANADTGAAVTADDAFGAKPVRLNNAVRGAIQLDGRMVERLHADMARRTIAIADAITAMGH